MNKKQSSQISPQITQQSRQSSASELQFLNNKFQDISTQSPKQNSQPASQQEWRIYNQYNKYFNDVKIEIDKSKSELLQTQTLQKHKIRVYEKNNRMDSSLFINQDHSYFQLDSSRHGGIECIYNVIIAKFFLTISVLHLHRNSQVYKNSSEFLGEGSFGVVKKLKVDNQQIAIKKIKFIKKKQLVDLGNIVNPEDYANCIEIRRAISQYCIYKICSMLKIGPQVIYQNCYDLVCFNDCVEFQMQLCSDVGNNVDIKVYQNDIKRCLGVLHSMKIIHKDIKKQNTLYSPAFKSYVLSDFGLTHSIKQNIWSKTETYFAGSMSNASEQMMNLMSTAQYLGFVNLYMNDIHGLKQTIKQLIQCRQDFSENFSKNPLSDDKSQYLDQQEDSCSNNISLCMSENIEDGSNGIYSNNPSNFKANSMEIINSQISAQRLNFFMIKALFRYFKKQLKQVKQEQLQNLKKIVQEIIKGQPQQQVLKITLLNLIIPIIKSLTDKQQSLIFNIRNLIRIYGLHSEQVFTQLKDISAKTSISLINYRKLHNYLAVNHNHYIIGMKKFNNYLTNLNRHFFLRNKRSLIMSIRTVMKDYLNEKTENQQKKQQILKTVLQKISFQELTEQQVIQLIMILSKIYGKNCKKINTNNYQLCFLQLIDNIYKEFQNQNKINSQMIFNLAKLHFNMKSFQKSNFYTQKIIQKKAALQNYLKSGTIQAKQVQEIKHQILRHEMFEHTINMWKNKQSKSSLQSCRKYYIKLTENQIKQQSYRILILDNYTKCLCDQKLYDEAQKICLLLQKEISEYIFPKKLSIQFSLCQNYKGLIQMGRKNLKKALQHFSLVIDYTNDPLRGSKYIKLIKQAFLKISAIHKYSNNLPLSLEYLRKVLQISSIYQFGQPEQTIQIILHIIKTYFEMNLCDEQLAAYFDKLAYYMNILINLKQNRVRFNDEIKKKIPLLNFQQIKPTIFQTQIKAKKSFIITIEPYLPMYLNQYVNLCKELQSYYQKYNFNTKAIIFKWRLLKVYSKQQNFFEFLNDYINKLINLNSSRRAYMYLNKLVFHYFKKSTQSKAKIIQKLYQLSYDLNEKNKNFYAYLRKTKAHDSPKNLQQALSNLPEVVKNRYLQKIWAKKLLMMHPTKSQQNMVKQNPQQQVGPTELQEQQINEIVKKKGLKFKVSYRSVSMPQPYFDYKI